MSIMILRVYRSSKSILLDDQVMVGRKWPHVHILDTTVKYGLLYSVDLWPETGIQTRSSKSSASTTVTLRFSLNIN